MYLLEGLEMIQNDFERDLWLQEGTAYTVCIKKNGTVRIFF